MDKYKIWRVTQDEYNTMKTWTGFDEASVYYFPDGHREYDVEIAKNQLSHAKKLLGEKRV